MGVATAVGYGIGWFVERRMFSDRYYPWITIAWTMLGFVAGVRNALRMIQDMEERDDRGN